MESLFRLRPTEVPAAPARSAGATPRSARDDYLHLFVLATFAVTQPLYDRLGDRPAFLEDSGFGVSGVLLLTAVLSLAVPALPVIVLWVVGRFVPGARFSVQAILVYVLAVMILLPFAKRVEEVISASSVFGAALAGAALVAWMYFRFRRIRTVVSVAAIGVIAFPALFLLHSPLASTFFQQRKLDYARGSPVPIVMIVLDELCGQSLETEDRTIDAARFPNFSALAQGSTWFRNATTVHPETWQAVPVLLSGRYPKFAYPPRAEDLPQNLFSILQSAGGYEFAIFEPVTRLASHRVRLAEDTSRWAPGQVAAVVPTLSCVFLQHLAPSELQKHLPRIAPLWFGFGHGRFAERDARRGVLRYVWGDDRLGQFEHFIDCLDESPRPTLFFSHVLLPHVPWCYLPTGRRYLHEAAQWELLDFDTHSGEIDLWGTDDLYIEHCQQRYLLQLEFTDLLLGRLLARLHETGLYDRCLLIVTADHGISFKVNDLRRGVTNRNVADIMSVPLFIKTPGQQSGAVSDKNVESIDVLPTIVDQLKIELPLPVDGRSVFDSTHPDRQQKTICRNFANSQLEPVDVLAGSTVAAELRARLGPSNEPEKVFHVGPHPELVGRRPRDLPAGTGPAVEIELIRSETRYSDRAEDLVPCYLEGWVVSPFDYETPVRIAVAVNGVIHAVTRTYRLDTIRDRWAALIPESSLKPGENEVTYYSVTGASPGLRLQECILKPAGTREAQPKRR